MLTKCREKRRFISCLSVRYSSCPHKIMLLPLDRVLRNYILAIFTEMCRQVLNDPIPCVEQLVMISKQRNAHKCRKNTVCTVHFHTLTCISWLNMVLSIKLGTALAQWLRCCATNRKVAGLIPSGVNGFLIGIKSFRSHSASNRNEYQEYFLGVKAAGA